MKARQRGLAAVVTVAGVLGLVVWSTWRSDREGEESAHRWAGEQWDVARSCFVGTPVGRGEPESELVVKLWAQLLESRLRPPEGTPWPERCVGLLASVRGRGDADALATLEVLAPRVTPEMAPSAAAEALRALAAPIAVLDETMPPGARYDVPPPEPLPIALIVESLDVPFEPPRRPFLEARAGDAVLFDELGDRRITGATGGPFALETPDGPPTALTPPTPAARHPRFVDARPAQPRVLEPRIAWLDDGVIHLDDVTVPHEVEGATQLAVCGDAHWIVGAEHGVYLAPARPIRPPPPRAGVRVACDATAVVLAWPDEDRFTLARCDRAGCAALPPLTMGGDLQIAVHDGAVVATGRDPESGLTVARVGHGSRDAWSAPSPTPRGRLSASAEGFTITTAAGRTVRSDTGLLFR
ncbi:MAG: hypothetical protein RID81_28580 [Sandaracinaceae bacterium]